MLASLRRRPILSAASLVLSGVVGLVGWFAWGIGMSLEEFYGPGGFLEREHLYAHALNDGAAALRAENFAEAERCYRRAIGAAYREDLYNKAYKRAGSEVPAWEGLGEALAGQGRQAEAARAFDEAIAAGSREWGASDPRMQEMRRRNEALRDRKRPPPTGEGAPDEG